MLTSAARGRPTHRIVRWDSQLWVWWAFGESVGVSPQASIPAVVLTTVAQAIKSRGRCPRAHMRQCSAVQCSAVQWPFGHTANWRYLRIRELKGMSHSTSLQAYSSGSRVSYSRRPDSPKLAAEARATVAGSLLHSTNSWAPL
jgi:hypothetical protein